MITATLSLASRLLDSSAKFSGSLSISSRISSTIFVVYGARLSAGTSDFVVSFDEFSSPHTIIFYSDDTTRVNFGNRLSATSHASAGFQFKQMFAMAGSGISTFPAFHFANSTTSDVNIRVELTQFVSAIQTGGDPLASLGLRYFEPWTFALPSFPTLRYYENWSTAPDLFAILRYSEGWQPNLPTLSTLRYVENWDRSPNEFTELRYRENWEPNIATFSTLRYSEQWTFTVPTINTTRYVEIWNPGAQFPPNFGTTRYVEIWSNA